VLFREIHPGRAAERQAPRFRMRDVIRHPNFPVVVALLLIAQFLDRGLGLLIPLHISQLPEVSAIAAVSGTIISVAAVAATVSSNVAARLTRGIPAAQLLMLALIVGGPLCAAMALARTWPTLLVLRTLVGLCLGAPSRWPTRWAPRSCERARGAAFGWLAFGLQFGTAASPLVTGALASISLPGAYVFDGVLAGRRRRCSRSARADYARAASALTRPRTWGPDESEVERFVRAVAAKRGALRRVDRSTVPPPRSRGRRSWACSRGRPRS